MEETRFFSLCRKCLVAYLREYLIPMVLDVVAFSSEGTRVPGTPENVAPGLRYLCIFVAGLMVVAVGVLGESWHEKDLDPACCMHGTL